MSKHRYITTNFWRDTFIDELDPIEKLLFLYLISNPSTNLCGIYQLSLRIMASDTGIDTKAIENIFDKFKKKNRAYYLDNWVILCNAQKHQEIENVKIRIGIAREFNLIPEEIREKMKELKIPYQWLIDDPLMTHPSSTVNYNYNLNYNSNLIKKRGENRFAPPSLKDVENYCKERKNNINAQNFLDFYSSKGWLIGKNKMKDWKAAVRTWEGRNITENSKSNFIDIKQLIKQKNG